MDYTPLFNAVIALLSVVITAYLIPLLKAKLNADQLSKVRETVNDAVKAAEMLVNGTKSGQAKKEWVLNYLASLGVNVDETQIDALIEAAVYELNKNS